MFKTVLAAVVVVSAVSGCGGSTSDDGADKGGTGGASAGGGGAGGTGGVVATGGGGGVATGGGGGTNPDPFEKFLGTWLIGWSGGMNHFSWVRMEPGGVARYLDGIALAINYPYWECNGVGEWAPAAKIDTIALHFPTSCNLGMEALTFTSIDPATGGYPKNAIDHASIEVTENPSLEGYRFADSQCNADFTSCSDPFQ